MMQGVEGEQPKDVGQALNVGQTLFESVTGLGAVKSLYEGLSNSFEVLGKMDQEFSKLITVMGKGSGLAGSIKDGLAEGAQEVLSLGGTVEEAYAMQENALATFGRDVQLSKDTYKDLYATQRVTGQQAEVLMSAFANIGASTQQITSEMNIAVEIAQKMGANANAVSAKVVTNLDKLNRYGFQGGIEGLSKMAAKASVLRVNMDETFNLAENLMSPEKSIELAGALQRLGAASSELTDPLRLMDLAQNNVPELQNQLGQMFKQYTMFDEKTQRFQIMPSARRQLKEIAGELGMDIKEVEKFALGTADLDKKLSEISFAGLNLDPDMQEAIANMATMGKNGKYEIKGELGTQSLDEFLKNYSGREDDLKKFISGREEEEAKSPEEKMYDTAKDQLGAMNNILKTLNEIKQTPGILFGQSGAGQKALDVANKGVTELQGKPILENLSLSNDNLRKALDNLGETDIPALIDALKTGDLPGIMNVLKNVGGGVGAEATNALTKTMEQIASNYGVNTEAIESGFNKAVSDVTDALSNATAYVTGFGGALNEGKEVIAATFDWITTNIGNPLGITAKDAVFDLGKGGKVITADQEGKLFPVELSENDVLGAMPRQNMELLQGVGKAKEETKVSNENQGITVSPIINVSTPQPMINIPEIVTATQGPNLTEKGEEPFLSKFTSLFENIKNPTQTKETDYTRIESSQEILNNAINEVTKTKEIESKQLLNTQDTFNNLLQNNNTNNTNELTKFENTREVLNNAIKDVTNTKETESAQSLSVKEILERMSQTKETESTQLVNTQQNLDKTLKEIQTNNTEKSIVDATLQTQNALLGNQNIYENFNSGLSNFVSNNKVQEISPVKLGEGKKETEVRNEISKTTTQPNTPASSVTENNTNIGGTVTIKLVADGVNPNLIEPLKRILDKNESGIIDAIIKSTSSRASNFGTTAA